MNYLNNIKELIEKNIVLKKKHKLIEENSTLTSYFNIGKILVEAQGGEKRAKYGKGYDISNLKRMRQFYILFQKGATVWHQLSWSHLKLIIGIKNESERNYYINTCIKQNLSVRDLRKKIKNKEYERLEYKDNIELITDNSETTMRDMIKDPILIKTSKNIDKLSEKALKEFILEKIEEFLLELGYGFTYVGSEVRLGNHRCDLLFFNTELNAYVVIELKIRRLMPSDIGQIQYYMNYIDLNIRKNYMNKTIGLILCKEGNEIVIKYVTDERILMSTYELSNI